MLLSPSLPRKCTKKYIPSGGQHIKVFVRVRPMNKIEKDMKSYSLVECSNTKEVVVQERAHDKITKKFTFDKVFSPESKQVDIYKAVAKPLVDEVLNGFNCTIFAYGQTGTGKTYTMEGDGLSSLDDNPAAGIIPRCVNHLFDELRCQKLEFTMRVSFLELYNEELFDLLSAHDDLSKLRIYEDCTRKGSCIIQGLEEVLVRCKADVYSIIEKGSAKRQTAATMMNAQSSRSHTVFTVTVHIKENTNEGDELLKTGKLHLVDLAGSENIGRSGAVDKRAREAGNINQSLLTLGRVITCLVEKAPHIPYRESKLTRLLQDALGGRTKTSIIATVSPAQINLEETLSTLDYAHRAKNIQNKPEVNQKLNKKELIGEYTNEIERLRRDLLAMREKNGVYLANENYQEMISTQEQQEQEISEKIAQIRALEEEAEKQMEYFNEITRKLEETSEKLVSTVSSLESTKVTLQCTQKLLIQTAAEKEEQKFLVKAHCKTEDYLHNQGKNLINTALLTSSDISKLHEKLDRKRKVDCLNNEIESTFSENFKDKISGILTSISDMQEQNQNDIDAINNKLNSCLVSTEKELEAVSAKGKIILSTNLVALNDLQTTIHGMLEKFCDFKTHEALSQICESEADHLNLFKEETFSPRIEKMNETLCHQSELLSSLKKFVDEQVDKIEKQCLTVCKEQSDLIANIEKEVENIHSLEEMEAKIFFDNRRVEEGLIEEDLKHENDILMEIEDQMELMQNQMTSQRELINLQRKSHIQKVEQNMETIILEVKTHRQEVECKLEKQMQEIRSHGQEVERKLENKMQEMRAHGQEVEQLAETQMQELEAKMQTQIQQIKSNMQRIYCHQSSKKERMLQNLQKASADKEGKRVAISNASKKILSDSRSSVNLASSHSKLCTDSSENIQGRVKDQIKQLDLNMKEQDSDRIVTSSIVNDKILSISKALSEINCKTSESKAYIQEITTTSKGNSKAMFDVAVGKLSSELDEQNDHLSDVQISLTKSINELCLCLSETELNIRENLSSNHKEIAACGQTVEELLTQQLVKDIPTGLTPVRKEYIFPKVLSRTSPHDRLLERHRANVNNASRIPLPSFSQDYDDDDNDDSLDTNSEKKVPSSNSSTSENESNGSNLTDNVNQILYKSESLKEVVFREPCPVILRYGSKENLLNFGPPSRSSSTSSLDSKENFDGISTRRTGSFKKRELRQPSITTYNNMDKVLNSDIKSRRILGNHN